jgi:hypothetical protein
MFKLSNQPFSKIKKKGGPLKKKEKMLRTEEHHRRPRSLGGSATVDNISNVLPIPHRCWHVLFGNMNCFQICDKINNLQTPLKPRKIVVICQFINGNPVEVKGEHNSKNKNKCLHAWKILFKGMKTFKKKIAYINNVWLDPSYHFYVIKK